MSRYYDISIPGAGLHWTSHPSGPGGPRDPGALNVELDLNTTAADAPIGQCFCRVWGVGLKVLSQATNLANQPITISGGMGAGLPLSNPSQAGVLTSGVINKFFGNWEGVNQSIDLMVTAGGTGAITNQQGPVPSIPPLNGAFDGKKGQPLSTPLQKTLTQMFPNATIHMNISSNIVLPQDMPGYYKNVMELNQFVRGISQMIQGHEKPGVSIQPFGKDVYVNDSTMAQPAGTINYQDLIGQPTWIDINTIQLKCVMRGDIKIVDGHTITMPSNTVALGQLSYGTTTNQASFQGTFTVKNVRHVGNFRQPDGSAWCTIIEAAANTPGS